MMIRSHFHYHILENMKTLLFYSFLFFVISQPVCAQSDTLAPKKIYKIWIEQLQTKETIEAVLYDIQDSALTISDADRKMDYNSGKYRISSYSTPELDVLKIRRNGNVGRSTLLGAGIGFLSMGTVVTLTGLSKSTDPSQQAKDNLILFVSGGAVGALFGAMLGSILGSYKRKIEINGSQEKFQQQKEHMKAYSIKYLSGVYGPYPFKFSRLKDPVYDIDGNAYDVVALGGQVWMAGNLKTTHYRNGTKIRSEAIQQKEDERMYTWDAAHGSQEICPAGWHVPSERDWKSFISCVGDNYAGNEMKNHFTQGKIISQWWSSSEQDSVNTWSIYFNTQTVGLMQTSVKKNTFLYLRCIRE
jgi:hypothetical protein